ncbi:XrtA system polysaccharide chain length determinant [Hydrocarboniclastica marina]|uniref:Lipopolysaccharide biosynthesis protein n=1 Tax=Hydrocarboniclastica marina TaxID=2259620 RepID=A0A4P7XGZ6_9ALTE|nr:XrtA system polysaccharide chain length determinant [Hydrocarboniclastica marina]QCF26301.1 lipopolysaccharide biosynthesis protein [Hydrocarboniclastica marina]
MALPLSQLPSEVLREIKSHRWLSFFIFALISAAVLIVAFVYPYKYESEVIIYVDQTGITESLMEGAAESVEMGDVVNNAREILATHEAMSVLAKNERLFGSGASEADEDTVAARVNRLRASFSVGARGQSYLAIAFRDAEPNNAFVGAQLLGQRFIELINERNREESRGAYTFIDGQVRAYEEELTAAEERLKQFLSVNTEGSESEATSKIASVRSRIELAELELQELRAKEESLNNQLGGVGENISAEVTRSRIDQRIFSLRQRLDDLRLQYHDTYPDVVSLESQIAELERRRDSGETGEYFSEGGSQSASSNPLYQQLKGELVSVTANIEQVQTRISALKDLLASELERMQKIQANKAQLADLTRNMEVNRSIYNDLLRRRERARLSVNLDREAQGVTYQVQESPRYPTKPSGIQFEQFASAGLLLGLLAPFGLAAGLLQVDPRVRSRQVLQENYSIPVLGEIPQVITPYERRKRKGSFWLLGFAALAVVAGYIAIVVLQLTGVIG